MSSSASSLSNFAKLKRLLDELEEKKKFRQLKPSKLTMPPSASASESSINDLVKFFSDKIRFFAIPAHTVLESLFDEFSREISRDFSDNRAAELSIRLFTSAYKEFAEAFNNGLRPDNNKGDFIKDEDGNNVVIVNGMTHFMMKFFKNHINQIDTLKDMYSGFQTDINELKRTIEQFSAKLQGVNRVKPDPKHPSYRSQRKRMAQFAELDRLKEKYCDLVWRWHSFTERLTECIYQTQKVEDLDGAYMSYVIDDVYSFSDALSRVVESYRVKFNDAVYVEANRQIRTLLADQNDARGRLARLEDNMWFNGDSDDILPNDTAAHIQRTEPLRKYAREDLIDDIPDIRRDIHR